MLLCYKPSIKIWVSAKWNIVLAIIVVSNHSGIGGFIDKEIQSSYDEEDIYVNLEEIKPETQNITFYYWYDSVRNNLTVFYNYKVQKGNEKVKTFTSRNNDEGGYQAACNYLKSFGIPHQK